MKTTPKYRMRKLEDGKRVRVVTQLGVEGFIARWTQECTGCTEHGEMGGPTYGPFGCEECGYTGRRRREAFVPFPENEHAYWEALSTANEERQSA